TVAFLNPPYSKIKPRIDAAAREQANGVTTVMLVPQSLDTQWYLDVKRSANQTVLIVGGRVALMEPDTALGLVEVRENTGG
ncbi:DNA N-6-adenine-methyltransferase, partial [Klebsiella pneumoniae]